MYNGGPHVHMRPTNATSELSDGNRSVTGKVDKGERLRQVRRGRLEKRGASPQVLQELLIFLALAAVKADLYCLGNQKPFLHREDGTTSVGLPGNLQPS